jgi:hypothetical protein
MAASPVRNGSPATRSHHVTRRQVVRGAAIVGGALALSRTGYASADDRSPTPPVPATRRDAHVALAWFDACQDLLRDTPGFSPPVASRALAYLGVSLYEAIVPGMPGFRSLQGELTGLDRLPRPPSRALDWDAVANAALETAVRHFFPGADAGGQSTVDELVDALMPAASARTVRSAQYGRQVADAVYRWSTTDGGHLGHQRNFPTDYVPPTGPGLWEPTPPEYQRAMQPTWGGNRTFVLPSSESCAPPPPTPFSSSPGSTFYSEALEVYRAVNQRTPEQEAIARFWSDDPATTSTPPGHAISILSQVLAQADASLAEAAEAYAKVGVALGDAFIACWATKYRHHLVRPVTFIHDHVDTAWMPILGTPPFPEYTSGHSVQSAAACTVMADLFGDQTSFVDHTHDDRGLRPRAFSSFSSCADEAAISRLYGGIHYRPAIDLGVDQGRCIGERVSELPTRPR